MTECPSPRLLPPPVFGGPGNEDYALHPQPSNGRAVLAFDFPGIEVGTAEYSEGPTGVTLIYVPAGGRTYVDARGGAVGLYGGYDVNHAICLTGGSVYGHGAGVGVTSELLRRAGGRTGFDELQLVSTAVIYDLGARPNAVVPDADLGRAALVSARPGWFPQGRAGAGCSASAGKIDHGRAEFAGQGCAFTEVGGVRVLVAVVANPVGVIVGRDGTVLRGNYDASEGRRRQPHEDYRAALAEGHTLPVHRGNTTLTVAITNVRLDDAELAQFARQVHGSMHRGIQPFHTEHDGDVLFAVTTDEVDLLDAGEPAVGRRALAATSVGALAAEVAWDAILECAH